MLFLHGAPLGSTPPGPLQSLKSAYTVDAFPTHFKLGVQMGIAFTEKKYQHKAKLDHTGGPTFPAAKQSPSISGSQLGYLKKNNYLTTKRYGLKNGSCATAHRALTSLRWGLNVCKPAMSVMYFGTFVT